MNLNLIAESNEFFNLVSERALDSMNICGNRAKESRGKLGEVRSYIASNKDNNQVYRPKLMASMKTLPRAN